MALDRLSYGRVSPDQRHTRRNPCPICKGGDDDKRGRGIRCYGFDSPDGRYAFCTNDDYAGALVKSASGAYTHRLDGSCRCGEDHSTGARLDPPARRETAAAATPKKATRKHKQYAPIATHEYRDAAGAILFRVARFWSGKEQPSYIDAPKCMPQRPDGAGDWLDGLGDLEYSGLYRLPELLAASPSKLVFLVGGEKCVDALVRLGAIATCNAGGEGAGKWRDAYNAHLAGRHVVILPDHDETGRTHAASVAAALQGFAASVRLVELDGLQEHGDVADWIADGHTLLDLLNITACTLPVQNSNPALQDGPIVETLKRENQKLRDQLKIAETSLANLRREQAMAARIMALPKEKLSPPLKPAAIAVHNVLSRPRVRDEQGMEQVYRAEIARQCGVSDKTAGAYLRDLANAGVIHREVRKSFDRTEIRIAEGPLFHTPEDIETPERANTWGGRRVRLCPSCKSENLETRIVCRDCGTVIEAKDTNEAPPVQNSNPALQDGPIVTMPQGDPEAQGETQDNLPPLSNLIVSHLAAVGEHDELVCPLCGRGGDMLKDYGDGIKRCRACDVPAESQVSA